MPLARSLAWNMMGAEGASALAAILKETKITELKCAAAQNPTSTAQALSMPIDMPQYPPLLPCSQYLG